MEASKIHQEWGDPGQNTPLEKDKELFVGGKKYQEYLAVHAFSRIEFVLDKAFSRISGQVGMPDYLIERGGSVEFEIITDGKRAWKSQIVRSGDKAVPFNVDLKGVNRLELIVNDGGDTIANDHAVWLHPSLTK